MEPSGAAAATDVQDAGDDATRLSRIPDLEPVPIPQSNQERGDAGIALIAAVLSLAAFVALMPTTPGQGDGAEFTLALALLGVPHPTGYPLYILFGHPFVRLLHALGVSWPASANAWSVVGAAVAVGFYTRLALSIARARRPRSEEARQPLDAPIVAALAAVALVVINPAWLFNATEAEVYSWWYAWMAGALLFTWRSVHRLDARAAPDATRDRGRAFGWGLIAGLGCAHHVMSILVILPLSVALAAAFVRSGRWRASSPVIGGLGALLPLSAYAFVAVRAFYPALHQWPLSPTWSAVWNHIRGAAYFGYVGGFAPFGGQMRMIRECVAPYVVVGIPLGIAMALFSRSRHERAWILLALAASSLITAFVFTYGVPDPASYFVPVLMVANLAVIPPMLWLSRRTRPALAFLVLVTLAVTTASWALDRSLMERRRLQRVDARLRSAWNSIPDRSAIVLWRDDHHARLQVFQLLEGDKPNVYVGNPNLLSWGVERESFIRRFGFDPFEGRTALSNDDIEALPQRLRRLTPIPVIDFGETLRGHSGP